MLLISLGIFIFFGVNMLKTGNFRRSIAEVVGENNYNILTFGFAIFGLLLIANGYQIATDESINKVLWGPIDLPFLISAPVLWVSFLLIAAEIVGPNHICAKIRHPMFTGGGIFSCFFSITSGDVVTIMILSAFLWYCFWRRLTSPYIYKARDRASIYWDAVAVGISSGLLLIVFFFEDHLTGYAIAKFFSI